MDDHGPKCRTCFIGTMHDHICSNPNCQSNENRRPDQQQEQGFLSEITYEGVEFLDNIEVRDSTGDLGTQSQNVKALLLASPVEKRVARKRSLDRGQSKSVEKATLTFATPTRKIETAKSDSLLTLARSEEAGLQRKNRNSFIFPRTARTAIRCFNKEWMEAEQNVELRSPTDENQQIDASMDTNEPLPDVPQAPPAKNVKVDELTEVFKRLSAEDESTVVLIDALVDLPGDPGVYYTYENKGSTLGIESARDESTKELQIPVSQIKTKTSVTTTVAVDRRVTSQEITRELSLDPNIPPITTAIVVEVNDANESPTAVLPSTLDTSDSFEFDSEDTLFCLICEMFVDQLHGLSCRFFNKFVEAKPSFEFAKCESCNGIFFAIADGSGEFRPKDHICVGPTDPTVVSALNFYYCLLCELRFTDESSLQLHQTRHYHKYCEYKIQEIRGVFTLHPDNMVIAEDLDFCCDFCQVFYFKYRRPSKCNIDFV